MGTPATSVPHQTPKYNRGLNCLERGGLGILYCSFNTKKELIGNAWAFSLRFLYYPKPLNPTLPYTPKPLNPKPLNPKPLNPKPPNP